MTTYLGKSCSFCLPRVPFVNCRQFMYLVISLLVLRAGYGIWLYQFLIIAYLFTLSCGGSFMSGWMHYFLVSMVSFSIVITERAGQYASHAFVCVFWGNQLVPQPLPNQSNTLPTQYRYMEHLHEEVWCQKYPYSICELRLFPCFLLNSYNQQNECAPSEDSDQHGHPPSLISLRCALNR